MQTRIVGMPTFFGARKRRLTYPALALSIVYSLAFLPAQVQGATRSGKDLVENICAECHGTGKDSAPKIGDREAWSKRASQGLSSLTLHALEGIRKMPAHGGRPDLSDLEIARAVTYMVNLSDGNWVEPASLEDLTAERSGKQIVKAQCIKCHEEGLEGAPKIGDREAWVQRIIKHVGIEHLVRSAIRGHGGMPSRGDQADITDNELQSAILYMYDPAGMPAPAKPTLATSRPVPRAGTYPNRRSVGGIDIYLGLIPAQNLLALPKGSPERTMHGGVPKSAGYYHVNVSLFDEKTRAPIDGAQVQMQLEQPGLTSATTELEPMLIGAGSYGNYIKPQTRTFYRITLRIARPQGATRLVEAKFEHKFE